VKVTLSFRGLLRLALLFGALLLTACGSSGSAATGSGASASSTGASGGSSAAAGSTATGAASGTADTIIIKNFMFSPATLTVASGATVTVKNEDTVTHTLTDKADPNLFGTGNLAAGQSMTIHAPKPTGSYTYICTIHQYMTGTLVVR
jgi:plastocyanin